MTDSILDGFQRALQDVCTDERLRRTEAGEGAAQLWAEIDALGYTDALASEAHGGFGLPLASFYPLAFAAGHAGLGLPFAETAMARALLAEAGHAAGPGCIAIAVATVKGEGLVCRDTPGAALCSHVLASLDGNWLLLPTAAARTTPGFYRPQASATLLWENAAEAEASFAVGDADAETLCNALHAAGMAGAMARVSELSALYANDRVQFGRPIGKFQAVQQDLSVLAEQAASADIGARIGCASATYRPAPLLAAAAKLRACEAAEKVTALAHAVHGAIGITEEHILGCFTRRLHEWRMAPGTAGRCAAVLGQALLAEHGLSMLDFVRLRLAPGADALAAAA
ncbi:acyl-CoA dehydrogenase family protein [Cupriavidus oxalaticus]|uniref:Acyl-CoA dehydrogenase n=1 Tax=Cupriavidus oxalaticus TaxID=96344 RepID=A0A4P7LGZ9_9BURK|nr:acyl-CoA dehydrogenase family protein [Cupriavidus oxalaticus]QBY55396.1 acyl-CoA dehydrogenase [Cupriavidus oxalaticus]